MSNLHPDLIEYSPREPHEHHYVKVVDGHEAYTVMFSDDMGRAQITEDALHEMLIGLGFVEEDA